MEFIYIIATLATIIALFLIFRELVCWYWKINEGLKLLQEIRDLLGRLPTTNSHTQPSPKPQPEKQPETGRYVIP